MKAFMVSVAFVSEALASMLKLSKEQKKLVRIGANIFRFSVQWGTIPFIIYLGLRKGAAPGHPPITLMNCLWQ
ncbi:TOM7 family protein [Trichuris suis]|nr:TOM7 family protein [Trichuris suis]